MLTDAAPAIVGIHAFGRRACIHFLPAQILLLLPCWRCLSCPGPDNFQSKDHPDDVQPANHSRARVCNHKRSVPSPSSLRGDWCSWRQLGKPPLFLSAFLYLRSAHAYSSCMGIHGPTASLVVVFNVLTILILPPSKVRNTSTDVAW